MNDEFTEKEWDAAQKFANFMLLVPPHLEYQARQAFFAVYRLGYEDRSRGIPEGFKYDK